MERRRPHRDGMRFLIDRCTGRRLAEWLRSQGHDVVESAELGPDPGDLELLARAAADNRVLIRLDKDFGTLVLPEERQHRGLVRLPDALSHERNRLIKRELEGYSAEIESGAVVTVRGERIRVSRPSSS